MAAAGGRVIVAPSSPTCGDRVIDLFVIAESLSHAAHKTFAFGDGTFYPYRPVRLVTRPKARAEVVRQLKVPEGFGAVLSHGPSKKPQPDAEPHHGASVQGGEMHGLPRNDFDHWKKLCEVEGLNDKETAERSGRGKGVGYCWKNALGET